MSGKEWQKIGIQKLDDYLDKFYDTFSKTPEGIQMANELNIHKMAEMGSDSIGTELMSIYDLFRAERAYAIRKAQQEGGKLTELVP
jgi:hypothetical protein